jgi:hypothetical protein
MEAQPVNLVQLVPGLLAPPHLASLAGPGRPVHPGQRALQSASVLLAWALCNLGTQSVQHARPTCTSQAR